LFGIIGAVVTLNVALLGAKLAKRRGGLMPILVGLALAMIWMALFLVFVRLFGSSLGLK
jgi:hypothetical protein